jgi:hypothetical protein
MEIPQQDDHKFEEFRDLARRRYGGPVTGPVNGEIFLHNVDRFATLESICHNPYHELVFGNLSDLQLMRICVHHLMEKLDYRGAGKLLRDIQRIEVAHSRLRRSVPPGAEAAPDPAPAPETPPAPQAPPAPEPARREIFKLDPEAKPVQAPPLTQAEAYLRSLSDRELIRQLQQAERFAAASEASASDRNTGEAPEPHHGRSRLEALREGIGSGA